MSMTQFLSHSPGPGPLPFTPPPPPLPCPLITFFLMKYNISYIQVYIYTHTFEKPQRRDPRQKLKFQSYHLKNMALRSIREPFVMLWLYVMAGILQMLH